MTYSDHESAPSSDNDYHSDVNINNSPSENNVVAPAVYFDEAVTMASQVMTSLAADDAADVSRGPFGAAAYASVVIIVYALPIVFFLGVYVFHRSSSRHAEKTEMDRQVEKFLEHTMLLQESWSRDNFKQLKRTLVPRVANSQAKELISRRPSCLALLDSFDFAASDNPLGGLEPARSVTSLSDDDSTSWKSLPGDEQPTETVGPSLKRDLKSVAKMTRIVEEDQSVAWAAQASANARTSNTGRPEVLGSRLTDQHHYVDDEADYLLQPPTDGDDEHRVWIPLPPMQRSVHYQQQSFINSASSSSGYEYHSKRPSNYIANTALTDNNCRPSDGITKSQNTAQSRQPIEYEDRWYEEVDRPLFALKRVDRTELQALYISEASSGDETSSDSDGDNNCDDVVVTCRDDIDISILMDEDLQDEANSELTSLAWSDSDDDQDEQADLLV